VVISYLIPPDFVSPALPYLFLLFFLVTLIIHYILLNATDKRHSKFVNYFMLTTFLKLVFYMAILIIYALINKSDAIPFIISYFVLYLAFTTFEIVSFYNQSKNTQKDK